MSRSRKATAYKKATPQKRAPVKRKTVVQKKEHGGWLAAWMVLALLQSIFYTFLILYLRGDRPDPAPWWVWLLVFLVSLAEIVAIVAIWGWKKWGITVYIITTLAGIVVGLLLTGTQLAVFHGILPLAIFGYLIRNKRNLFDQ
jgi:ABC-type multidrug transport system permease subunit